jgi:hypothetical protein
VLLLVWYFTQGVCHTPIQDLLAWPTKHDQLLSVGAENKHIQQMWSLIL